MKFERAGTRVQATYSAEIISILVGVSISVLIAQLNRLLFRRMKGENVETEIRRVEAELDRRGARVVLS